MPRHTPRGSDWGMVYGKTRGTKHHEHVLCVPGGVSTSAGKRCGAVTPSHAHSKGTKWLMESCPYMDEQAKWHTLVNRAFNEGELTSTAWNKIPVWDPDIENTRVTRPHKIVGMETKDNNVQSRFVKEMRWGSAGLASTGADATKVYEYVRQQREILQRGKNKKILARLNAITCDHGKTIWHINGTGYTMNEVLDSTEAYKKVGAKKVQKAITGELRRRSFHRFRMHLNKKWNVAVGESE